MLTVRKTAALLKSWNNVLILTHIRPDGDTVGCAAALCAGLRAIGRTAYLYPNPSLTDANMLTPYFAPYAAPDGFAPDKIVSVDIATEELFPDNMRQFKGRVDLAIDHHPSFEAFGRQNIVRPGAAACGELLYDILAEMGHVTTEIALPLYVAISTDCGCFAYANTTAHTHAVAAALMRTGIDYKSVNKAFFRTKTRVRMRLEAEMFKNAEYYDKGRIVFMTVPLTLVESLAATENDTEELSSLGGQIEGVDCAITARELSPDEWKLSVRTGRRVNATKVCQLFGGGGHAAAAGCTIKAPLDDVRRRVLSGVAQVAED
ncbi:MAG: DHH family phosphoesterase [Oscillospiraceae bacterium]|nr:DHH family phosphoesterase [Oscillospiraceae bacterium]